MNSSLKKYEVNPGPFTPPGPLLQIDAHTLSGQPEPSRSRHSPGMRAAPVDFTQVQSDPKLDQTIARLEQSLGH